MTSYEALDKLFTIIKHDLDLLEKYKLAFKLVDLYLGYSNEVSFDEFLTSQCTDEEQAAILELIDYE